MDFMWQNFLDFHNVRSNPSILSIFLLVNDASFSSWSKKKFLSCCLGICMVLIKTKLLGQCEILFFYSTHHPSSLRKLWIIFMNQTLLFSVHRTHQKHQKFCSKYHKYQKKCFPIMSKSVVKGELFPLSLLGWLFSMF